MGVITWNVWCEWVGIYKAELCFLYKYIHSYTAREEMYWQTCCCFALAAHSSYTLKTIIPQIRHIKVSFIWISYCNLYYCVTGERTRTYQNVPERVRMYQNVPERTRAYQNIPERTRTYQSVPERTRTYHNVPGRTRTYHSVPEQSPCPWFSPLFLLGCLVCSCVIEKLYWNYKKKGRSPCQVKIKKKKKTD